MLPQTEFVLVVIFLVVTLLVLTYELRDTQQPRNELPEELPPSSTQMNHFD